MLPVPLNSSKINSSIRLPVSVKAVASTVRLPPSSAFRAEPKNFFGLMSAFASTPPDIIRPLPGSRLLYPRERRVRLSSRITTSCFISTRRLARSNTISATCTCRCTLSSKFERSEEHTSELQSQSNLVCRLLLEKKKNSTHSNEHYGT